MRATIFSRRERQACADHDRASGEGVGPQEYTLVKLQVQQENLRQHAQPQHEAFLKLLESARNKQVSLVAATMRPETVYGQTNCYVLPEGK